MVLSASGVFAGIADNFNSRNGIALSEVKGYLQGNCWFFSDFDVNRNGWSPNLEGDGAMVSGSGASATETTGIYTPLLDINGPVSISFKYKFNLPVQDRRWIKIYAAYANDKTAFLLDSIELTGSTNTTIYTYQKSLTPQSTGLYKLYINYQGIGGSERIAIDQLSISAPTHYASTCNTAPVALSDKFQGTEQFTATGNVLANDYDANHELLTAYLLTDSPDGNISLNANGDFVFAPMPGFTGSSTHFTYKVCDDGYPSLCSLTTTATINFPVKSMLSGLNAMYDHNEVAINWSLAAGNRCDRFEIERSLNGEKFEKVGEVRAGGSSASRQNYLFTDKVAENKARKNDLYYRLRLIDAASKTSYSKVMIVRTYGTKSVTAVSVTPDPIINDIQVNVQLKEKSFVMMKVTDNNGSEVLKKTAIGSLGANNYNLEGTSQLQPGMYLLEVIINSNERLTMRLAKS